MSATFRLILDGARPAAMNMAVDEALMRGQAAPDALPTLRFYRWERPAITVGYFQRPAVIARRFRAQEQGIPVIRRITGGGMVAHGSDLTFSITLKHPGPYLPLDVKESYLKINTALLAGMKDLCPQLDFAPCSEPPSPRAVKERVCFDSPSCYDLMIGPRKVAGSSQRRKDGLLLHQGSICIDGTFEELARKVAQGFERSWGVRFIESELSAGEEAAAGEAARVYESEEWAVKAPARL